MTDRTRTVDIDADHHPMLRDLPARHADQLLSAIYTSRAVGSVAAATEVDGRRYVATRRTATTYEVTVTSTEPEPDPVAEREASLRALIANETDERIASWIAFPGTADDARALMVAEQERRRTRAARTALAADLEVVANALGSMLTTWLDAEAVDAAVLLAEDEYPFHRSLDDLHSEVWAAVGLIRERNESDEPDHNAAPQDSPDAPGMYDEPDEGLTFTRV